MIPATAVVTVAIGAFAFISPTTSMFYILSAHILLMVGLASVFTPLFSAALGVLKPHQFSHGSATINTVQQVAGAAGTALVIAIMTVRAASLEDGGSSGAAAMAEGAGLAFGIGAGIMALTIGLATMIKRPESDGELHGGH